MSENIHEEIEIHEHHTHEHAHDHDHEHAKATTVINFNIGNGHITFTDDTYSGKDDNGNTVSGTHDPSYEYVIKGVSESTLGGGDKYVIKVGTSSTPVTKDFIIYLNGSYIFFCLLYSFLFLIYFFLDCCYSKATSGQCWSANWYHWYLMNQDKFNVKRCF